MQIFHEHIDVPSYANKLMYNPMFLSFTLKDLKQMCGGWHHGVVG